MLSYGQSLTSSPQDAIVYHSVKINHSTKFSFVKNEDSIHFETIKNINKSDEPTPFLKITENGRSYNVITYFSGFGYHIIDIPQDSLMITYGDMPYGELIIDGLPRIDQVNYDLKVNRLDCIVSINGVKGVPTLDLGNKTLDTEKLKKPNLKEILVTNQKGDKVFCSAKRELLETTYATASYTIRFNEMNSQRLNERLKLSILFIFWLYEK